MKNFRRILIFVLAVCLMTAVALFAACSETVQYKVTFRDGSTDVKTVEVAEGSSLTADQIPSAPEGHDGETFDGWFVGETQIGVGYAPTSDVVAVAKFHTEAVKHTVTFRDGESDVSVVEVVDGESLTADQIPLAPTGHGDDVFDGWFVGTTQVTAGYKPTSNVVATAKFHARVYSTLTLVVGDVATLDQTEYTVEEGTPLSEFLAEIVPQITQQGLTFNGWYKGRNKIVDDVMPASPLTLTAKYDVTFTVKRYFADVEDHYGSEPTDTLTKTGIYGERFTYSEQAPVHFILDNSAANVLTVNSLGVNQVFEIYYLRDNVTVYFDVNIEGVELDLGFNTTLFGLSVTIPDGEKVVVPDNYRFAGWSTQPDGAVEFDSGEQFDTDAMEGKFITLYARWSKSLVDAMGGNDYLFLSLTEDDVAYLQRAGLDEKQGVYDKATGKFTFSDGDRAVLEGKVVGEYFYYFENFDGQVMPNGANPKETLTFSHGDAVTYTVEGETPVQGTFELEPFTGEYVFVSDSVSFHFTVNSVTSSEGARSYVFNRPVSDEAGFYLFSGSQGDSVLYLDGMVDSNGVGGLRIFSVDNDKLQAAVQAFYYEWEDNVILDDNQEHNFYLFEKTYVVITSQGEALFLFRIKDGKAQTIDGVEVRGTYIVSDGFEGHYFGDVMNDEPDLLIDGFGNALVKREGDSDYVEGTYTIGSRVLQMRENDVFGDWEDSWLEVTVGNETTIERLAFSVVPQHGAVEHAPRLIRWANNNPIGKVYDGADYLDAYIYDSTVNGAYILGRAVDEDVGEFYEAIDRGSITVNSDGTYRFVSNLYTSENNFWDFRYVNDDTIETTLAGAANFTVEGSGVTFSVDKWGTFSYNGKQYAFNDWGVTYMYALTYNNTDFYLEFYTLNDEDGVITIPVRADVAVADGQATTVSRTLLANNAVVDIIYQQFYGQEDHYDKLYIIDDTHAAIGFLNQDGLYYFMLFGTLSYDDNAKEYTFVADPAQHDDFVETVDDEGLWELYDNFCYEYNGNSSVLMRTYKDTFRVKGGSSFSIDGYGKGELTLADGTVLRGDYQNVDSFGKYYFEFVYNNETHFVSVVYKGDEVVDILLDAKDGGAYYYMYSTGDIYLDTYAVFLGDYVAAHDQVEERKGTVVYYDMYGTYVPTGKTVNYGYGTIFPLDEYYLDLHKADGTGFQTHVIMGEIQFSTTGGLPQNYKCFVERMDPQADKHFDVVGGGTITGDGYNDSVYVDADGVRYLGLIGVGVIKDSSPNVSDYDWDDDFINGKQVVFRASYAVRDGEFYYSSSEFLFDIGDDGKLTLRDSYNATFALYEQGNITQKTLYLDGHGNATLHDETNQVLDTGKYSYSTELQCLLYDSNTDDGKDFRFQVLQMTLAEEQWFIYSVIEDEVVYVNDDWSTLVMGGLRNDPDYGYINGLYVTARGVVHAGFFSVLTDDLVRFADNDGSYIYFDVQAQKTFAINTDQFIVRNNVLLAYQGPDVIYDLTIPKGVTSIGANAFASVYRMGGVAYTLNFNDVERIEDYAFYGVHEFAYPSIASDKVVYVGNYSFYSPYTYYASATEDLPFSWLRDVNFPKATYIGDYAFNGCNQMNNGRVKLDSVEYIGYSAFSHNTFESNKMVLDLTDADIGKIEIDRNAFLPGPNTYLPQLGLPVIIWVRSDEAKALTSKWHEDIQKCVIVKVISMAGVGYFDFNTRDYLLFGSLTEDVGAITLYKYSEDGYTKQQDVGSYTFADYGVLKLTFNNKDYTFDYEEPIVETDTNTFLRQDVMHSFTVTNSEDDKETKQLRFEFTISVDEMAGINLSMGIGTAIYDKHVANNANVDLEDYICNITYSVDEVIYNLTVNMADWTYTEIADGIVVLSADGRYRASLEQWIGGNYRYLTLEELVGHEYVVLFANARYETPNKWTHVEETETVTTTYTVTYDPEKESIAVTIVTLRKAVLTTADNNFKATVALNEDDEIQVLYKFEVLNAQYGYYETVYNYKDINMYVNVEVRSNGFTITSSPMSGGRTIYTATYADGKLVVSTKSMTSVTVESTHQDNETYYTVTLLLDDGEVVGLTGDLVVHTYDEQFDYYDTFSVAVPGDVAKDGNTFTFDYYDDHYTVTVVKTAEGQYEVTVSVVTD